MMTAMQNAPGRFRAIVGAGWVVLGFSAWLYARSKGIPAWAACPVAAAFLIEFPFYLSPAFESPRAWLARQPKWRASLWLTTGALLPWLAVSVPTGQATIERFLLLLMVAAAVSFWYTVLPAAPVADVFLLLLLAALLLSRLFNRIYISPIPHQSISVLGHLMLIYTAALAFLVLRGGINAEFRFMPHAREWINGLRYFAFMLPPVALAYWALGLVQPRPHPLNPLLAAGTFLAMLWVVALSEEFFLRGLVQQWLEKGTRSPALALVLTTLLSGAAHLGFHGAFPSWRFAIVATVFHFFCGLAWMRTRTIQAGVVAHALTVTLWRVFFV